ncbi:MAG: hypothetical protein CME31_02365 [Gimesia sp.]|uniref:FlgN protein n=2 Tax=Gimesia maris TaxID=122 RepID=A0A3D3RBP0_9PLAN|nr:hypothetical protein [Gimesia sp.]HCO25528.1 hypothetical protein [Gimesia maris]|tara:strand:+ start:73419 stop:73949 length:531 start_codon:yes stop_codon:yes gene_type:complete
MVPETEILPGDRICSSSLNLNHDVIDMTSTNMIDYPKLFAVRLEYSRALLTLSLQQQELIKDDDYSSLLDVLGKKQRLLGQLDQYTKQLPRLWEQWQQDRDQLPPEQRATCEQILSDSEAVLAQLLKNEDTSTQSMVDRRDRTKQQIQSLNQGAKVGEAYRDSLAPSTHRHLNIDQ